MLAEQLDQHCRCRLIEQATAGDAEGRRAALPRFRDLTAGRRLRVQIVAQIPFVVSGLHGAVLCVRQRQLRVVVWLSRSRRWSWAVWHDPAPAPVHAEERRDGALAGCEAAPEARFCHPRRPRGVRRFPGSALVLQLGLADAPLRTACGVNPRCQFSLRGAWRTLCET